MKRLYIAYITVEDPRSKRSWSGTNYYLMKAVEKYLGDVDAIGPLSSEPQWTFCAIKNFLSLKLSGKRINYRDSFVISKVYARRIEKKLHGKNYDLIIAPAGTATTAMLDTTVPIVYINDRSIPAGMDYHPILTNLRERSKRESLEIERRAIEKSVISLYSSDWAANAARETYSEYKEKIHTLPFGANLNSYPQAVINRSLSTQKIKLLFVGVKWEEKGGDIAYECLLYLLSHGVQAELVVCGCTPPDEVRDHPSVLCEGFLSKDIPEQYNKLQVHFLSADFFILPTRFEAYGLVFCEAAAYGLPVLATNTGGVPTIVKKGETGCLFDLNERGDSYAKRILHSISQPDKYSQMRVAARKRFEEVLNWDSFGSRLKSLIEESLSKE